MPDGTPSEAPATDASVPVTETNGRPEPPDEADTERADESLVDGIDEGELNAGDGTRVVLEKVDRSLYELNRWFHQGRIIVDPEWQLNYVWDKARASKLIESFLLDIPVPVVYLSRNSESQYEVIDGLQRLTSVFDFFAGKYKLQRLDIRTDLNGKSFSALPQSDQKKLEDAVLRSFELTTSSGDMHFIVFERLNTGGVKLNDMEIRNCLYRGELNTLIKELAENNDFRTTHNLREAAKRMQDRALVLRFLAFYERTHYKCQRGLKKFFNEFLDTYRHASPEKISEYRRVFEKCMKASLTVFGSNAYRLKSDLAKHDDLRSAGEWATRPNAAIFQVVATGFSRYDLGAVTRAADAIYEEYVDMVTTDEEWVDCVRRATGETARVLYSFDTWYGRLEALLSRHRPNDARRTFSRRLKQEMFNTNRTCSICGQQIALIDDAVLDHDRRYWEGGRTVPDNAQLVHRLCNLKKG